MLLSENIRRDVTVVDDDGKAVVLFDGENPHDHAWVNRGTQPCRIAFALIDATEP